MAKTGEDGGLTQEQLAKALKRAAKKVAKKQILKAFTTALADKESPLMKAIHGAVADRPTKAEVTEQAESIVNGLIKAFRDGPVEDETTLAKGKRDEAIRLVADDEGKTGEDQSPEAKQLQKTIADAQGKLKKLHAGGGTQTERRVAVGNDI